MDEITQIYHYKMDMLSKNQNDVTTDTYDARNQQDRRTELRKLSEALQHLQDKRCRYKVLYKKERIPTFAI